MAHASKSFVVFTGGEWSEQLHGRTDLAKADSAGRKMRNFMPAQTGRLSRRKGLEFVGAALGECLAVDPRFEIPTWSTLTEAETIVPSVDVYGALGPSELRTSGSIGPVWQVCPNFCYCDGPTSEGETMADIGDRYRTRWMAKLEEGRVYYRRVGTGEDWTQVPNELIPQPNIDMLGLGFAFDANARPVFASAIGASIHIWRWVSGVPTTYDFQGQGPRLFFDGVVQPDNSLWDVVCYYCWTGNLVAAFQRDNFATSYTLFSDPDYYCTRVRMVERGRGSGETERIFIGVSGSGAFNGMFRTGNFPVWPLGEIDGATATVALGGTGDYSVEIVHAGTYAETATATVGLTGEGLYELQTKTITPTDSATATVGLTGFGVYELQVVTAPTATDVVQAAVALYGTGEYSIQIVTAVSAYTDSVAATIALYGTGTYELE